MTIADLAKLNDSTLGTKLSFISSAVQASPSSFGMSAPQAASLVSTAENLVASLADLEAAKGSFDSAMEAKVNYRDVALETFGELLNLMYATPSVSPENIASLTLTPRSSSRTPIVPVPPTEFLATPNADGTVKLSWSRNGNKYGVVYEIEWSSADQSDWQIGLSTTKTKVTVSGFTPGQPKWFRVRATKNGQTSVYSFNSGIYIPAPSGSGELEVAA